MLIQGLLSCCYDTECLYLDILDFFFEYSIKIYKKGRVSVYRMKVHNIFTFTPNGFQFNIITAIRSNLV